MQADHITDYPAESHLLPVMVKVNFLANCPSHTCAKTHVSLVNANMVYGHKTMMLMMIMMTAAATTTMTMMMMMMMKNVSVTV